MLNDFEILVIDDTRSIHDDIRNILAPAFRLDDELDSLKDELFGDAAESDSQTDKGTFAEDSYNIDSGYQGEEGYLKVKSAMECGKPYAMAIVDMRMPPGWDGLQTIEEIWKIDSCIQIVICTAYTDYSWKDIQTRLGNSDRLLILKKPFEPIELHRMVTTLCKKWASEQQVRQHIAELDQRVSMRTSELKKAYETLQKEVKERENVEIQLRHAQKMEAVGQLAAGIAHEINTPIQFVADNLYFLQGVVGDYGRLIEVYKNALMEQNGSIPAIVSLVEKEIDLAYIQEMAPVSLSRAFEGVQNVGRIVSAMRRFSHGSSDTPQLINVNEVLNRALIISHHAYKYVARVETDMNEVPEILGFETELGQVLINLIVNAAHAIEDIKNEDDNLGVINISTRKIDDCVAVSIRDTGIGIPQDIQDRVFIFYDQRSRTRNRPGASHRL